MVGNAHLDPVWLWRWPEGISEMLSTCHTMVKLLEESDDLIFTKGEAAMYEWVEKIDPSLFQEIVQLVRKGKWNIVNGWWVQPDCNLPSGESFVRQSLYGKRFFSQKFGVDVKVGYNVDSFGHAGTLPQLLKKSGFNYYVFMRPGLKEKKLPSTFRWKSPDGNEVTAFRLSPSYETGKDDLKEQISFSIENTIDGLESTMAFYGVGDHGGGPTKVQVAYIREHKNFKKGVELKFSSPEKYFNSILDKIKTLPIVNDELQYHSVGSYSVNSRVKMLNRKSENSLLTAERFASIASLVEQLPYPYEDLEREWKSLLFNQFHDTLGGTAIREAYNDTYNELGGVIHMANKITQTSLQTLARNINSDDKGMPFVIFNSSAFERKEYIEFEPWVFWQPWKNKILVDSYGNKNNYQKTFPSPMVRNTHRILFKAKVPPMGYSVYWLRDGKTVSHDSDLLVGKNMVENEYYRLEISDDGYFNSFYDKKQKNETLRKPSNMLLLIKDKSDTWSHGMTGYSREFKMFKCRSVKLLEHGNLRTTFKIELKYKKSKVIEYVSAYAHDPVLRIHFFIDWHEAYKVLKLSYIFQNIPEIFAEAPYGMIKREANGQEYPMQRAIFFEHDDKGFMVANNGKYAYDALGREIRLTLLRNPPYAWHMPYKIKRGRPLYFTDEGIQEFDLWLWSYSKEERWKGLNFAQSLNNPLEIFSIPKHQGKFPSTKSFIELKGEGVLLETLKMSEDKSQSLIARMWETMGREQNFSINVLGRLKNFSIRKYEVKTLKIRENSFKERDLMEGNSKDDD